MTCILCPLDIFFESCNVGFFFSTMHSSLVGQLIQALSKISVDVYIHNLIDVCFSIAIRGVIIAIGVLGGLTAEKELK